MGAFNALVLAVLLWALLLPPISALRSFTPPAGAEATAADFGVSVEWWMPARCADDLGCFLPITPDTIYVDPAVDASLLDSVVLHELGHAIVYRGGGASDDECAAEAVAAALGATMRFYDCQDAATLGRLIYPARNASPSDTSVRIAPSTS